MARFADPRRAVGWGLGLLVVLFLGVIGLWLVRGAGGVLGGIGRPAPPQITHQVVMERLRDVARLVASEMTLRDVVIYQHTRFRSTKRALLVVTGRVSAGINLRAAQVQIDSAARHVTVTLPPAQVTSVEVLNVTTYDETSGILNPFTTDDRDLIHRRIRNQLTAAAQQSGILQHADQSAARTLQELLKIDGYTVEVKRPLALEAPKG
jgi:hypothetical protein